LPEGPEIMVSPKDQSPSQKPRVGAGDPVPLFGALTGRPFHESRMKLSSAGLRPTRQRMALGYLLFAKGNRHVTAENLQEEALASRISISLATIYNCLHQFTRAGLLREIAIDGSRIYFDTNVSDHHHFLIEGTNVLIDIPQIAVDRQKIPPLPAGKSIAGLDVIVRLRDEKSGKSVPGDKRIPALVPKRRQRRI
jgi:Fur family transcriptional regulator, iron response regulator